MFFAISGYVIALSLSRTLSPANIGISFAQRLLLNKPAILAFFIRRAWRIYPPLLATLALSASLTLLFSITTWKHFWVETIAALTMTYNYVVYDGGPFVLDILWSLAVEMQFYLLLPLFLIAFPTSRQQVNATAVVFVLIGVVVRPLHIVALTSTSHDWLAVRFSTHCRLDTLAAGVGVFALTRSQRVMDVFHNLTPFSIRGLAFFFVTLLLLIPAGSIEFTHREGFSALALAAAGAVLLAAGDKVQIIPESRIASILRYVGERSFSLYLVHRLAAAAFSAVLSNETCVRYVVERLGMKIWIAQSIGVLTLTLVFAEGLYRLVEKPSIEAGRRYGNQTHYLTPINKIHPAAL